MSDNSLTNNPINTTESNGVLLIRIDERTQRLENDVKEIKGELSSKFVTKEEFGPVKNIAYAVVTIICIAVIGALVSLVVK